MSIIDIAKFPRSQEAMKALIRALRDDGVPTAGLVVSAIPVKEPDEEAKETLVFTAMRDDVSLDTSGEVAPSSSLLALLEQALRGIKRRMQETGS